MRKSYIKKRQSLICFCMLFAFSTGFAQTSEQAIIDLKKASVIIDSLDKQFSKYYLQGDTLALYAMYSKDASIGSSKGNEILLKLGSWIRNSIKNNTRYRKYTTTSLSIDAEFIIEVGIAEVKDDKGNLKGKSKYLVVWKQENGDWKLYRDIGL